MAWFICWEVVLALGGVSAVSRFGALAVAPSLVVLALPLLLLYWLGRRARVAAARSGSSSVPGSDREGHLSPQGASEIPKAAASVAPSALQVELAAENAPGKALVRVKNTGGKDTFSGTARLIDVNEPGNNTKFLQTYALRWRSNDRDELTLAAGASGSLLIASTGPSITGPPSPPLYELLLEGYAGGHPDTMDRFRWHGGAPPGAVTITIEVTVSASTAPGISTGRFSVTSRQWSGIEIQGAVSVPSILPTPSRLMVKCTGYTSHLALPYSAHPPGEFLSVTHAELAGYLRTGVFVKVDRELAVTELITALSEVRRWITIFPTRQPDYGDYYPHDESHKKEWSAALEKLRQSIDIADEFDKDTADYSGLRFIYHTLADETGGSGRLAVYQDASKQLGQWVDHRLKGRIGRGLPE
jgi:hypothetical protein